ncbi:hypothetical protein MIND_00538700 [Mycena indigotica]|uniref:Uncharacterized protein n=1 Tax=Mycena indigotica TaxID=2126181 RepID=A0A8H6WAA7_9AGAR|nr:uncharacterized protein MIND_00538700 [Mycena indigotica]KAF7307443.1 hypothetical protein MIND_00538700 [Mycena indigotica]
MPNEFRVRQYIKANLEGEDKRNSTTCGASDSERARIYNTTAETDPGPTSTQTNSFIVALSSLSSCCPPFFYIFTFYASQPWLPDYDYGGGRECSWE